MTSYRITCTTKSTCPNGHHIVAVGPENLNRITVPEAYQMIDQGHRFYTLAASEIAWVEKFTCQCGIKTLRSQADTTSLNNLDHLPTC